MDSNLFYKKLFQPIEEELDLIDSSTITSIIGFDAGGAISLCTVGRGSDEFVTYVTCELAQREDQVASPLGRYELMITCNDENWSRSILTNIADMSLDACFGPRHTLDVQAWVAADCKVGGVVFEKFAATNIAGNPYGLLRIHGVSRAELDFAVENGVETLLQKRQKEGIYPKTVIGGL